uniref:Degenerin unc-8 n=1 Tax=Panagrellus redivivus TaxID=6233 RepID=A0A7E4VU26_PANRE
MLASPANTATTCSTVPSTASPTSSERSDHSPNVARKPKISIQEPSEGSRWSQNHHRRSSSPWGGPEKDEGFSLKVPDISSMPKQVQRGDDLRRRSSGEKPGISRRPSFVDLSKSTISKVGKTMKTTANREADDIKDEVFRFSRTTTAHGVPMLWWLLLTIAAIILFISQCILVHDKYSRKDKIVSVELQFEQAKFPAVTVCNLNPFKHHLAKKVPEIGETLDAFHQAVVYSKESADHYDAPKDRRRRSPGGFRYVQYEPIMSDCQCTKTGDCVQKDSIPKDNASLCICNFDRQDSTAWPCFHISNWIEAVCPECNDIGYCNLPETNGTVTELPCLCQGDSYCLLRPERIKRVWEIRGTAIPDETSPFRADFLAQLKELGYENMTDEVAITTKTKEKMILTMASLPVHRRIALSYGKAEFIRMCSFNGQQCDIINDFKLHVDPTFGNCYTFNADAKAPKESSRAGPSYGLRLMVYINASDYLPTTEAMGVRIVIHDQTELPFPEAFGYSAPVGALSSFGLSMREVKRLSAPYGDCVTDNEPLPSNYIYPKYTYEPEGCYKSCYQQRIIRRCGCADPRYPTADNETELCDSLDTGERNCLISEAIKFTKKNTCQCKHRCSRNVYSTTYSSAKIAQGAFRNNCKGKNKDGCFEYDGNNAAMFEIYYEQMNYEKLTERESYLFVNLISDIGGQAGLWLGASVLTLIEVVMFVLRLLFRCRHNKNDKSQFSASDLLEEGRNNTYDQRNPSMAQTPIIRKRASFSGESNKSNQSFDDTFPKSSHSNLYDVDKNSANYYENPA